VVAAGALSAMLAWYRAYPAFRARSTDLTVREPTLVLWGDRDLYLDFGLAEESLRYCARGSLERAAKASHWLQHERPDWVAARIAAFLKSV
jgi:pimeloyl-ACP methyl ester carboxylesterase